MQYHVVSRDDSVYECFPDVVRMPSGRLVVMYRESDGHQAFEYSRLIARLSDDEGQTWSDRIIVAEGPRAADTEEFWSYNCPRMRVLSDGRLLMVCDVIWYSDESRDDEYHPVNYLWWSEDGGQTWSERQQTGIPGLVPDRPCELDDGTLLLAITWRSPEPGKLCQFVHRSTDRTATWQGPITVADDDQYKHCEGSLLLLPDSRLICYMREDSHQGYPGFKCFSADGGLTWEGPYPTLMAGCHRPTAGLLASGRVLVTYRAHLHGQGPGQQNLFAYLEEVDSAGQTTVEQQSGRIIMVDHDNNLHPDTGYSGWVQIADGTIYCVNYIKRDAPNAWIRSYTFAESELLLGR